MGRAVRQPGTAAGQARAEVDDVRPGGPPGGDPARPVRPAQLGPEPAGAVVGAEGAFGPGGEPPGPVVAAGPAAGDGGEDVPRGGAPAALVCVAGGRLPRPQRRAIAGGDRPAELRGRGDRRGLRLPPGPALARPRRGAGRGGPDGVQPGPARPDAAGDPRHPGPGRRAGLDLRLRAIPGGRRGPPRALGRLRRTGPGDLPAVGRRPGPGGRADVPAAPSGPGAGDGAGPVSPRGLAMVARPSRAPGGGGGAGDRPGRGGAVARDDAEPTRTSLHRRAARAPSGHRAGLGIAGPPGDDGPGHPAVRPLCRRPRPEAQPHGRRRGPRHGRRHALPVVVGCRRAGPDDPGPRPSPGAEPVAPDAPEPALGLGRGRPLRPSHPGAGLVLARAGGGGDDRVVDQLPPPRRHLRPVRACGGLDRDSALGTCTRRMDSSSCG